jgi:hypothetical protein
MKMVLLSVTASSALLVLPSASAKDFGPGDLRICNAKRCVAIVDRELLPQLGSFYYSGPPLERVPRAGLGGPYYELRLDNNYVTGIVATRELNRFLSYGVNLGRFTRSHWYSVPPSLAQELRGLAVGLRPLRLTRAALARSR